MVSRRVRIVIVAVLAVLAVSVAAATLDSAVHAGGGEGSGSGSGSAGQGESAHDREGNPFSIGLSGQGEGAIPAIPLPCIRFLQDPRVIAAGLTIAGLWGFWLYRREGPVVPIGLFAAFGPPVVVIYALLTACSTADEFRVSFPSVAANTTRDFAFGTAGAGGGAGGTGTPVVAAALFAVLGMALLVAVALLLSTTGDDVEEVGEAPEPDTRIDVTEVGRAAGRAADRIEGSADIDNEIYRAWQDMTDHLDVANPSTSTPGEFAEAAVEAGMAADDVRELTSLFEAVRYGEAAPTAERESRAVSALRRIETEYAGADQ